MTDHPAGAATAQWTTRRLLEWMTGHFESKGIDSPRVSAEMLIAHVLGCERMRLYMEVDRPATPEELRTLRELTARAARHEPVQYLIGHAWFFGRKFKVSPATLIPRPATETLVEHVLQHHRATMGRSDALIADIGTGTGCIAISLAAQLPSARVIATDITPAAIELARENAREHGVEDRIEFREGPLFQPFEDHPSSGRFDYVCSNPPYISDAEWAAVPANVKHYEPATALRGGADGLDIIRPLLAGVGRLLRQGGQVAIEIADSQAEAALKLAEATLELASPRVLKDHEDLPRVLVAERG